MFAILRVAMLAQGGTCMAYHDDGPLTAYQKW